MGRLIEVAVDGGQGPGPYSVELDGLDKAGRKVAGGIFHATCGGEVQFAGVA